MAFPCSTKHQITALTLFVAVLMAAMLSASANALTQPSMADISTQLAKDVSDLADSRDNLTSTRSKLRGVREKNRNIRSEVEDRLIAIYKLGGSTGAIEQIASGDTMQDIGRTIDVLDVVAEYDAEMLQQWQMLELRKSRLVKKRERLEDTVRDLRHQVVEGRHRLSSAQALAISERDHAELEAVDSDPSKGQPLGFTQTGIASVYHDSFSGERTANGEIYDPGAFTAAHPSLPFGTWVTVQGPSGTVQVRINDRGPFVGGRIIDLSGAAGAAVGIGLGTVSLSVRS